MVTIYSMIKLMLVLFQWPPLEVAVFLLYMIKTYIVIYHTVDADQIRKKFVLFESILILDLKKQLRFL